MTATSHPLRLLLCAAVLMSCAAGIQAQPQPPLDAGIAQISAGMAHTCAVAGDGLAYCWGDNSEGQLGTGTTSDSNTPQPVVFPASTTVTAVAAGNWHSCALTDAGAVYCWGYNSAGQLGGYPGDESLPSLVASLPAASAIFAGSNRSCAIAGGSLYCWGQNWSGQLGSGNTTSDPVPVPVQVVGPGGSGHLSGVTAVALGQVHTCAIAGGSVYCWGQNDVGQLGIGGTGADQTAPVAVLNLASGATALAAGAYHACALLSDGSMQCWGGNAYGQLGNGEHGSPPDFNSANQHTPVAVSGLAGVTAITADNHHSCALAGGVMQCWGVNWYGQLGNGGHDNDAHSLPQPVVGLTGVTAISAGHAHTCALDAAGMARCWGDGGDGQLGDGFTDTTPDELRDTPPWLPHSIAFANPGAQTGASLALPATTSAGQPVRYSASGACTVSGSTLRWTSSGNCTVTAQSGSDGITAIDWLPVAVTQSFTVTAAAAPTPQPVPTLSAWSLLLLGTLLGLARVRRRA